MARQKIRAHIEVSAPRTRLKRVCLTIGQLGLGGTEKQLVLLARGLKEQGVETTVLVMFQGGPREEALRDARIPVIHLGFRGKNAGWRMPALNFVAFARLVIRLRRLRPDVVHAFLPYSYIPTALAARIARVPVVIAGRRSMGDFAKGRRLFQLAERTATRMTDLLIANAHAVAANTRRREQVPEGKISVIYNGLPASAFEPVDAAPVIARTPIVLCVANLRHYKGHRHLLDGIHLLKTRGRSCTLLLAGEGAERAGLVRQSRELGIDARFLGARTDVHSLMERADVFVLPSLQEGMSNAVMEAMAAGKPIVATAVGGTPELIHGRGILVPPADSLALADAIDRIISDAELARRLGGMARDWSYRNLSIETMISRHLEIYQALLEKQCAE